ncbi:MAG: DUF2092 domain-containing protein [Planctomycetota bacterium]
MNSLRAPSTFLLIVGAVLAGCEAPADRSWTPPALTDDVLDTEDAQEIVGRMADFMNAQQVLLTEALVTYEVLQETGQKLQFDLLQRMAVRKPDRLFWVTLRDDATVDSAWYSDGRFTMLKQPANLWGQIDVPPTIPETVDRLVSEYSLDVPFRDILAADPGDLWLGDEATSAWYIGEAWVEGVWTDHIAFRKPGVDFELWVQKGATPFPMKMAIVYPEEEGLPSYVARFRKWSTSIPSTIRFEFTPPPGSERVEVVPVSVP